MSKTTKGKENGKHVVLEEEIELDDSELGGGVRTAGKRSKSVTVALDAEDTSMRELFTYVMQFRAQFIMACVYSALNKILDAAPPLIIGWTIDAINGDTPGWIGALVDEDDSWDLAVFLSVLGVVVFFFESVFEWLFTRSFQDLAQEVQHRLRRDLWDHIMHREIAWFESMRVGDTMSILSSDINTLERFLNTGFNDILQLGVLFLFAGVVLFATSWQLSLIGLSPIPLLVYGSFWYHRVIAPRYVAVREAVGEMNSRLENNLSGIVVIQSFNAEQFENDRVGAVSAKYRDANQHAIKLSSVFVPVIRMAVSIGFGGVVLFGSYWVLEEKNDLSVGDLVLFSMLIQRTLWPLTRIGQTLDSYERSRAAARRTFKLLHTPCAVTSPENAEALLDTRPEEGGLGIQFEGVQFGYERSRELVLRGLDFDVRPGEFVAVVGASGNGKSTVVKLMLRLYDVTAGTVRVNGHDVRNVDVHELRRQIALVSQDVYIFHGTVAENIAYGSTDDVPLADVRHAARLASLDSFVMSLPDQYDTVVGERGIKLSGGQRQRLSIARAILKNAPVMILDEATSSVDTATEQVIQENLAALTSGRTAVVIAHRLSTIRHADRILVLDGGKVAEHGTHEQLLQEEGIYHDLWSVQSGEVDKVRRHVAEE